MGYSGYANYETWNVNMFLGLEPYYSLLSEYCRKPRPTYLGFVEFAGLRGKSTSDGVSFTDPKLDLAHLDVSVAAYRSDTFGYEDGEGDDERPAERNGPSHSEMVESVANALRDMMHMRVVACAGDGSGEGALLTWSRFDILADDLLGTMRLVRVDSLPFSDVDAPLGCDWVGRERARELLDDARRFSEDNPDLFDGYATAVDFAELTVFPDHDGGVLRYHSNVREGPVRVDRPFERRVLEAVSCASDDGDQLPVGRIMQDDAGMPLFTGIPCMP